jgi:hypothetical protein
MDLAVLTISDTSPRRLADPLQVLRATLEREVGDGRGRLAHALCRAPVGRDAEAVVAADLGQVGQQIELIRDIRVPRERGGHPQR